MQKVTINMPKKFAVILHNVRSILNVGAVFRTADAVGVDMIYLTGYTPGPDTHPDKMDKTALGAQESVAWQRVGDVKDLLTELHTQKITLIALERSPDAIDYREYRPTWPLALMLGNEVKGIDADIMSHNVDTVIEVPMRGDKESLNVAIAFGIAAYELTRSW